MPQVKKCYSEDTLQLALKEIKNGASLRSVALKHKIPRSTLQNRNSGKSEYQSRPGPRKLKLNEENEEHLVNWILKISESGEEVKKSMIAKYAKDNLYCDGKFSYGWYRGFFRRNPQIGKIVKHSAASQLYYGMDVKLESSYLINKETEKSIESSDDSISQNGSTCGFESRDWKFEMNEFIKVALCFACAAVIDEFNSESGIKCSTCLRTYHISCANKQHREIDSKNSAEIFCCLICWTRKIAET